MRRCLLGIAVSVVLAPTALALPFLKAHPGLFSKLAQGEGSKTKTSCSDLTGQWQGKCSEKDENGSETQSESAIALQQDDCTALAIGSKKLTINSAQQEGSSNRDFTGQHTTFLYWNEGADILKGKVYSVGAGFAQAGLVYTMGVQTDFSLTLVDGKLVIHSMAEGIAEATASGSDSKVLLETTCTYEKH